MSPARLFKKYVFAIEDTPSLQRAGWPAGLLAWQLAILLAGLLAGLLTWLRWVSRASRAGIAELTQSYPTPPATAFAQKCLNSLIG